MFADDTTISIYGKICMNCLINLKLLSTNSNTRISNRNSDYTIFSTSVRSLNLKVTLIKRSIKYRLHYKNKTMKYKIERWLDKNMY